MAKKAESFKVLDNYLPTGTFDKVYAYIEFHRIHLTITRERLSVLGDYRNSTPSKNHRISVNGNLNKFAFLYTLLHEIAHLLVFNKYGHKVASHGKEWKQTFGEVLFEFLKVDVFPPDIRAAIEQSMLNPAASSCADATIIRVFRNYDPKKKNLFLVEELDINDLFVIKGQRIFKRGEQIRKRIKCLEVNTNKMYLFSPVMEVEKINT
jgi:hypothetical protein